MLWSASLPPSASRIAAALALSDALPPPTATNPSTWLSRAICAIACTAATPECCGTPVDSHTISAPSAARVALLAEPAPERVPLISINRFTPIDSASAVRSSSAPGRETILHCDD